jgi:metal-responsive CopG/Arc/MetJ family transcriptional regulator
MTIISLSVPESLIEKIDQKIKEKGFAGRSEIARQALRHYLSEDIKINEIEGEAVATITVIYRENADRRKLVETTAPIQWLSFNLPTFPHTGRLLPRSHNTERPSIFDRKVHR